MSRTPRQGSIGSKRLPSWVGSSPICDSFQHDNTLGDSHEDTPPGVTFTTGRHPSRLPHPEFDSLQFLEAVANGLEAMFRIDFCASITASAPRWKVSTITVAGPAAAPSCFLVLSKTALFCSPANSSTFFW